MSNISKRVPRIALAATTIGCDSVPEWRFDSRRIATGETGAGNPLTPLSYVAVVRRQRVARADSPH